MHRTDSTCHQARRAAVFICLLAAVFVCGTFGAARAQEARDIGTVGIQVVGPEHIGYVGFSGEMGAVVQGEGGVDHYMSETTHGDMRLVMVMY